MVWEGRDSVLDNFRGNFSLMVGKLGKDAQGWYGGMPVREGQDWDFLVGVGKL